MLVPFPIGFLVGTLLSDLAYASTGDTFWARASLWLVAAGVVSGGLAAVFGLIDFVGVRRARAYTAGWVHVLGNVTAMGFSTFNWLIRTADPAGAIVPIGLAVSGLVGLILLITGWAGGELSYRYKVGVVDDSRAAERGRAGSGGTPQA
jgi:uncharacterized membrane protein